MSVPAIPRVKLTGPAAEGETPLQFLTKLDTADQAILAYAASLEARIAAKESASVAPGIGLSLVQHAYKYPSNASPAAVSAAKGYLAILGQPDSDGRAAIVFMTATRFAVINFDSTNISYTQFRATILDVSANGTLSQFATALFGGDRVNNYGQVNIANVVGFVRVADNILRGFSYIIMGGQYAQQFLHTLTLDEGTGTLSVTRDVASEIGYGIGGTSAAPSQASRSSRRRGYRVGAASFIAARVGSSLGFNPNNAEGVVGVFQAERNAGSNFVTVQQVTGPSSLQYALDRVSDSVLALLHDEYVPGSPGLPAVLSLVNADDVAVGRIAALRLANPISGAQKVVAVSPLLVVLSYTSGSTHSYYAVARDPATNALSQIGSLSSAGLLGAAPFELYPISETRFAGLYRVGGWRWRFVTFAVNTAAAPGTDPFTQVSSVEFNLGAGIPGAVPGDDAYPLVVEFLTGDRAVVVTRNGSRGVTCVEIVDLS